MFKAKPELRQGLLDLLQIKALERVVLSVKSHLFSLIIQLLINLMRFLCSLTSFTL